MIRIAAVIRNEALACTRLFKYIHTQYQNQGVKLSPVDELCVIIRAKIGH